MKTQSHSRPVLTSGNPSPFLRDQICGDSNYELDWLWSAEQVTVLEEIRYCLERALYINPNNHETERALWKLPQNRTATSESQQIEHPGRVQPFKH